MKPFRLTAPVAPEVDLHAAVAEALDLLLLPPTVWCSYPAGHIALTGQQAARLARIGLKRNWPDVLVLHAGVLHGIELKRPGEALSRTRQVRTRRGGLRVVEGQTEGFARLVEAGMQIGVCTSVEQVLTVLRLRGVPVRALA